METNEILHRFKETSEAYIRELDRFSMEQLTWVPDEGGWSLGQMYMHLIRSAQFMHLRNVRLCLAPNGNPAVSSAGKTEAGIALIERGSFPPGRVQVPPSPQYTPPQPESKVQIVQGLRETVRLVAEVEEELASALATATPAPAAFGDAAMPAPAPASAALEFAVLRNTVAHPRFGGLNAWEWFWLMEMHYRHHRLQLQRLEDAWEAAHG